MGTDDEVRAAVALRLQESGGVLDLDPRSDAQDAGGKPRSPGTSSPALYQGLPVHNAVLVNAQARIGLPGGRPQAAHAPRPAAQASPCEHNPEKHAGAGPGAPWAPAQALRGLADVAAAARQAVCGGDDSSTLPSLATASSLAEGANAELWMDQVGPRASLFVRVAAALPCDSGGVQYIGEARASGLARAEGVRAAPVGPNNFRGQSQRAPPADSERRHRRPELWRHAGCAPPPSHALEPTLQLARCLSAPDGTASSPCCLPGRRRADRFQAVQRCVRGAVRPQRHSATLPSDCVHGRG